jgi:DNA-directed RNA polymerase subunit L
MERKLFMDNKELSLEEILAEGSENASEINSNASDDLSDIKDRKLSLEEVIALNKGETLPSDKFVAAGEDVSENVSDQTDDNDLFENHVNNEDINTAETQNDQDTYESSNNKDYLTVNIQGKRHSIHRLIASTFLNNGNPIETGFEVDHLSTDTKDNRVSNLRIVTHKENMNNLNTQRALSNRAVIDPKGREFMSVSECSRFYKVYRRRIYLWIEDPNSGFRFKEY